jgi:hypothetical protein
MEQLKEEGSYYLRLVERGFKSKSNFSVLYSQSKEMPRLDCPK